MDRKDTQKMKGIMSSRTFLKVRRYLITGIAVILPSVVTIWVLWSLFSFIDRLAKKLPGDMFEGIPGVGVVTFFAFILLVGMLASNVFGRRMISFGESIMVKIPFASKIYTAVQQISTTVLEGKGAVFNKVVLVEYPRKGIYSLGFITSEIGGEVQDLTKQEVISVFIPTTPNPTSGLLVFVPKEDLIYLQMSTEDGLKLVISGGFIAPTYTPAAVPPTEPKSLDAPEKSAESAELPQI